MPQGRKAEHDTALKLYMDSLNAVTEKRKNWKKLESIIDMIKDGMI